MINGVGGITNWSMTNTTQEISQARADASRFQESLERATKALEDAKTSVDVSGISAEEESKRLREACVGFEAMFLDIMFREMRKIT